MSFQWLSWLIFLSGIIYSCLCFTHSALLPQASVLQRPLFSLCLRCSSCWQPQPHSSSSFQLKGCLLIHLKLPWGLPWRLSGEEPTCSCRRHRFCPWSGKIPRGTEQWSLCHNCWAWTLEPGNYNDWSLCALEPIQRETTAMRSLCTSTREKLKQQLKTQYSQKRKVKTAVGLAWWSSG